MNLKSLLITQLVLLAFAGSVLFGNVLEPSAFNALGFHVVMSSLLVFGILYLVLTLSILGTLFLRRNLCIEDLFHLLVVGGYFLVAVIMFLGTDSSVKLGSVMISVLATFVSLILQLSRKQKRRRVPIKH